ncbi:MAG: porin [Bacteroidota bacterium]
MKTASVLCILAIGIMLASNAYAQDSTAFIPNGKFQMKVYSNFHTGLSEADKSSAFEIKRVYFGYAYKMSEHFSTEAKLDIGSPNDESQYSLLRRYAYFKTAGLSYKNKGLTWNFGLIDLQQCKLQEKFWGHRYIYKSFTDEYGYGAVADLGTGLIYEFNKYVTADLTVMNGEGYTKLQADNTYKAGAGITLTPLEGLTARAYYDYTEKGTVQSAITGFLGYNHKDKILVGGDYSYEKNTGFTDNHDMYGFSAYAMYNFSKKWQVFGRYDNSMSNIPENYEYAWNNAKDGQAVIGGVEFSPMENIRISANYQGWYSEVTGSDPRHCIYLNLEYQVK